jgi:hypothetical protein
LAPHFGQVMANSQPSDASCFGGSLTVHLPPRADLSTSRLARMVSGSGYQPLTAEAPNSPTDRLREGPGMIIKYEDIDHEDMHDFGLACCPAHIRNGPVSYYLDWLDLNYRPGWQDRARELLLVRDRQG